MPKRRRGRPTVYTQEVADEICERLAAGEALVAICSRPGMPADTTVEDWAQEESETRPGFVGRYARARNRGFERLAYEALAIADTPCMFNGVPDHALVQQARLQVDTRKWFLSKLLPRQFGDRVEITGEDGGALITKIELIAVDPRPREQLEADAETASGGAVSPIPLRAITSR